MFPLNFYIKTNFKAETARNIHRDTFLRKTVSFTMWQDVNAEIVLICHKLLAFSKLIFLQLLRCSPKESCILMPVYNGHTLIMHSFSILMIFLHNWGMQLMSHVLLSYMSPLTPINFYCLCSCCSESEKFPGSCVTAGIFR